MLGARMPAPSADAATNETTNSEHAVTYYNDVVAETPWSIHIVKLQRARHDFEFIASLGRGDRFGMATVSEQVGGLPGSCGKPIAAINGDFYLKSNQYTGRPRDLQILQGEVVSSPAGHTCFWIDAEGNPRMTNVFSQFKLLCPNGKTTPLGLNEERKADSAVLYTSAVGASTHTGAGLELTLEPETQNPCLPLRVGQIYTFRVKEISNKGDAPVDRQSPVLSLGPRLVAQLPPFAVGAKLRISTQTVPDLNGASVAIGGGPALIRDGKVMHWNGYLKIRHPRTAVGWNKDFIFLVEVDGRQLDLSVGMTFPELADYLLKLGCQDAVNLDGGGSATLWFLGAVRNSPSEGQERPAANALVLVKKQASTKTESRLR